MFAMHKLRKVFQQGKTLARTSFARCKGLSAYSCRTKREKMTLPSNRFITRLDRYIIGKFLSTYFFLIGIIITIAIVFDFNEKIDQFNNSSATAKMIVFDYYINFIPHFANLFSPLFVFVAVIFFTTNLASHSEIIAMKAAGLSFKRLLRPYMISSGIIALTSFLLGAYIIPKGNVSRVNFENTYIKNRSISSVENVQLQVDTGVIAYISHYNFLTKSGYGFSLDKFVDKKLVSHLTAQTLRYDTISDTRYRWKLEQYSIRTLKGMREKITSGELLDTIIMMEPADFAYTRNQQETMTLPQLEEYISKQRLRGAANLSTFEVEYYKRFAMPFAAFILTLMGVSLCIEKRKGGMGTSIGIGLALSFTYILFQTISASFAINAGLHPMISTWIPNILFAIIAFFLYRRAPR